MLGLKARITNASFFSYFGSQPPIIRSNSEALNEEEGHVGRKGEGIIEWVMLAYWRHEIKMGEFIGLWREREKR